MHPDEDRLLTTELRHAAQGREGHQGMNRIVPLSILRSTYRVSFR
jgi:hypothetical protein